MNLGGRTRFHDGVTVQRGDMPSPQSLNPEPFPERARRAWDT